MILTDTEGEITFPVFMLILNQYGCRLLGHSGVSCGK